jgi:hypothetical protein
MTASSAAQPEVSQASNIQDDRHVGDLAAGKSHDPTSRDVDVRFAAKIEPWRSDHDCHLEETET